MENLFKQNFSYKLDILIEPNWYNLYKKICNPENEKKFDEEISEKIRELKDNAESSIYGRQYYFTEYYDSASGLTQRFQRTRFANGKEYFQPVDEFGDRGYMFDSDSGLKHVLNEDEKKRAEREKLSVEIGEDFIRNDIYDKNIGGPRFDYKEENYLFNFPLGAVFNFLFALGQRFDDAERNTIIKWPDNIEKDFEKSGIKYETYFDYEPEPLDIEKYDKKFFEKIGKPKVSCYNDSMFQNGYLSSKDGVFYSIRLKIFKPGNNDRIGSDFYWDLVNKKINRIK